MLRRLLSTGLLTALLALPTTALSQPPIIPTDAGLHVIGHLRSWDGKVGYSCNAFNVGVRPEGRYFIVTARTAKHCVVDDGGAVEKGLAVANEKGMFLSDVRVLRWVGDSADFQWVSSVPVHVYETKKKPGGTLAIIVLSRLDWDHEMVDYPSWPSIGWLLDQLVNWDWPKVNIKADAYKAVAYGQKGMSGSPVFHEGKVIGVFVGGDGSFSSFAAVYVLPDF